MINKIIALLVQDTMLQWVWFIFIVVALFLILKYLLDWANELYTKSNITKTQGSNVHADNEQNFRTAGEDQYDIYLSPTERF